MASGSGFHGTHRGRQERAIVARFGLDKAHGGATATPTRVQWGRGEGCPLRGQHALGTREIPELGDEDPQLIPELGDEDPPSATAASREQYVRWSVAAKVIHRS